MSLFDTLDGCFMNFAYGWAFSRPIRKVYYNITITGLSVAVAFFIGTVELLGLLGQEAHLRGSAWSWLANFDINKAGFYIVGLFVVVWVAALALWRWGRIESRWEAAAERSRRRRPSRWRWPPGSRSSRSFRVPGRTGLTAAGRRSVQADSARIRKSATSVAASSNGIGPGSAARTDMAPKICWPIRAVARSGSMGRNRPVATPST